MHPHLLIQRTTLHILLDLLLYELALELVLLVVHIFVLYLRLYSLME